VLRLLGSRIGGPRHLHSPDELALLIAESRDGGLLEPEEQRRLQRALGLSRRAVRELMVPRDRLTMLPSDAPWEDVVRTVATSPFSRIPVYRGTPDQIIGTLRVKDLVQRYVAEGPMPLERMIRPVVRMPEHLPADRAIGALRERRAHQAVVVDAAGRASGLVTIQDLLGALLGEVVPHRAGS
jgi:CBS domain containing-hemolysin-like protein